MVSGLPELSLAAALVLLLAGPAARPAVGQGAQVLGFADVNYVATERDVRGGFYLGQMAGHVAAALGERVAFQGELSATARPDGYRVEVERAILRYDVSDDLRLSAGRHHTPVSYWNVTYHHGLWLQTSVARPEIVKFGSRFLPVHFVGVLVEGRVPLSALGLGYFGGVGNGRDLQIERPSDAGDVDGHRAWTAGLTLRPARLSALQVGASVYRDRLEQSVGPPVGEWVLSGHVAWEAETPEVVAEYARVVHERGADATANATANVGYYVQVGYRLPGPLRPFKPYARAERLETSGADPVFAPIGLDYEAAVAGVRYDVTALAALKAEYRRERFASGRLFDSLYLQVSFTFPSVTPES